MFTALIQFTFWYLICYGTTVSITEAKVSEWLRNKFLRKVKAGNSVVYVKTSTYQFITCNQCVGFWIGCLSTLVFSPTSVFEVNIFYQIPLNGFLFKTLIEYFSYVIERGKIGEN